MCDHLADLILLPQTETMEWENLKFYGKALDGHESCDYLRESTTILSQAFTFAPSNKPRKLLTHSSRSFQFMLHYVLSHLGGEKSIYVTVNTCGAAHTQFALHIIYQASSRDLCTLISPKTVYTCSKVGTLSQYIQQLHVYAALLGNAC